MMQFKYKPNLAIFNHNISWQDVTHKNTQKVARYASEFSGAMFLIMFVKLASVYDSYTTSLSIGLGLGLLIYNYGYISGAHLNPSVTMAIIFRNIPDFPLSDRGQIAMYFVSQYLGGIFGGVLATIIGIEYISHFTLCVMHNMYTICVYMYSYL